jgi:hypothetical protein
VHDGSLKVKQFQFSRILVTIGYATKIYVIETMLKLIIRFFSLVTELLFQNFNCLGCDVSYSHDKDVEQTLSRICRAMQ